MMRRRLLVWLTRKPCACTHAGGYVAALCWRHRILDWLDRRLILVTADRGYYVDGYLELRPWRWNPDGYLRTAEERGMLRRAMPIDVWGPAGCALVHAPGAECAVCNPRLVAGYSASPMYLLARLELALPSRAVHGLDAAAVPDWTPRGDRP